MSNALETNQLSKRYGRTWALQDCTLNLPAGRVAALVGPNGAGKTTLLHLAVGLLKPTAGEVQVFGCSPSMQPKEALPRLGFVAQEKPLYKGFTVAEMLTLGRWLNPGFDDALARARMQKLGIPLARRAGKLSGGQQAQVALVLALTLGVFAGALTRRTVVAIVLAIALFVAVRVPVELFGRPNFETPVTVTIPVDQQNPPALSPQDWRLDNGFIDAQGNRSADLKNACPSSETTMQCLQANGVRAHYFTYQPGNRFWTFQWIETGIYVGFSALALFAAVWLVRRRLN